MKDKPASRNHKIHCRDVGCELSGHWKEAMPGGEILIKTNARHGGENHIAEIKLAEFTIDLIKRDPRFAAHFQKLLGD